MNRQGEGVSDMHAYIYASSIVNSLTGRYLAQKSLQVDSAEDVDIYPCVYFLFPAQSSLFRAVD